MPWRNVMSDISTKHAQTDYIDECSIIDWMNDTHQISGFFIDEWLSCQRKTKSRCYSITISRDNHLEEWWNSHENPFIIWHEKLIDIDKSNDSYFRNSIAKSEDDNIESWKV